MCGDLNLCVILLTFAYLNPWIGFGYYDFRSPMALALVSSKILFAYYGQLSHCMSHMPPANRPSWVRVCQDYGITIAPKEHMIHHNNYNDNFCIGSGICNPLISFIKRHVIDQQWVWIFILGSCFFFDVPVAKSVFLAVFGLK